MSDRGVIAPEGHRVLAVPESRVDGEWRFCAAVQFSPEGEMGAALTLATEQDLDAITDPGAS